MGPHGRMPLRQLCDRFFAVIGQPHDTELSNPVLLAAIQISGAGPCNVMLLPRNNTFAAGRLPIFGLADGAFSFAISED